MINYIQIFLYLKYWRWTKVRGKRTGTRNRSFIMSNVKVMVIWTLFTSCKMERIKSAGFKCYFNLVLFCGFEIIEREIDHVLLSRPNMESHLRKLLSSIMKTLINLTSVNSIDTWPWALANTDTIQAAILLTCVSIPDFLASSKIYL